MVRDSMKRAWRLTVLLLAASAMLLPWGGARASDQADPLVRSTAYGSVRGMDDLHNTWSWKGVPYAKPPVGELRWRAPLDPDPWSGVLPCRHFRSPAVQYGTYISETGYESMGGYIGQGVRVGSEDCLYLNIWRPRSPQEGLPVYLFLHGGGNLMGRGDLSIYHGARFASESNMIFITINYRLGTLGWFSHPALSTGNPLDDSGNYGLLDTIKALAWVRKNIRAFGGDPGNVTVSGQSAGAFNIHALLVSPLSEGLFHRAVIMSGAPSGCSPQAQRRCSELILCRLLMQDGLAKSIGEALAFGKAKGDAWLKSYLRSKTPEELYPPENGGPLGMILDRLIVPEANISSVVDGYVVPDYPLLCLKRGAYHHVPVMLGNTAEEAKLLIPFLMTEPKALWRALDRFDPDDPGLNLREILNPLLWPLLPAYNSITAAGNRIFQAYGVDLVSRILAGHQQDVYAYKFAWDEEPKPFDFFLGAGHALDVPFVFGNFHTDPGSCTHMAWSEKNRSGREKLSREMMSYHAQFARTGTPNAPANGLPEWKPWNSLKGAPKRMVFDTPAASMSTRFVEPVELPCPQCTLQDLMNVLMSSYKGPRG